ncbi:DUF7139 domain-containing protein [Halapricum hydrolyticum]|uniref:Uncharacterized protein n=1 Tax=Halapricum hydrolyticum TaxID=2979991 RepID=A0AAE3IDY4_9EURY|nr:hypothetical protein [Halapricum hydrolyticum]MCU4719353.1 hypothetical protein [Halapricum hydrolyticum]MCU4728382.1 hypothetical protein [Halapricum hydrolyticum]
MTSLTEVYEERSGAVSLQRLYLGVALFAAGAALVVGGIVVATTGLSETLGLGTFGSREVAGVLAGIGVPAAMLGGFVVLPAGRTTRAAAVIGASVSVFGVALFTHAYPEQWLGAADPNAALTLATTLVYVAGLLTTAWCLFLAVATFETRKRPGGTARMEVTEEGRIRLIEESTPQQGLGGIGFFGSTPDGEVETQTNQPQSGQPASDGAGATTADDDAFLDSVTVRGQPDRYCGNCEHFSYVRTDNGIVSYCAHDGRYMDDMEPCEHWDSNV